MTAAALVFCAATMIAPERVAKVERARIGHGTDSSTGGRADCSTRRGISGRSADGGTAPAPINPPETARSPGVVPQAARASVDTIIAPMAKLFIRMDCLLFRGNWVDNGEARANVPA